MYTRVKSSRQGFLQTCFPHINHKEGWEPGWPLARAEAGLPGKG